VRARSTRAPSLVVSGLAVAAAAVLAGGHLSPAMAASGDRQGGARGHAAASAPSTAVGIGMREWSITRYRAKVEAGTVRFLVTNRGEDAHNLRVRGPHGYRSRVSDDAAPGGGRVTLTTRLKRPGRYVLVCVKPGHEQLGMRATLKVIRP